MPGENTIGDYTAEEISRMTPIDFQAAKRSNFTKPVQIPGQNNIQTLRPEASDNVWAARQALGGQDSADFVVPSGQKCRLRQLTPEMLLPLGILDRVTRLEGMAQSLVSVAEGEPPTAESLPSRQDFEVLLETINMIVPLAVETPTVVADDATDVQDGAIRVSSIELTDRVAIMEKALEKIRALDRFRHSG